MLVSNLLDCENLGTVPIRRNFLTIFALVVYLGFVRVPVSRCEQPTHATDAYGTSFYQTKDHPSLIEATNFRVAWFNAHHQASNLDDQSQVRRLSFSSPPPLFFGRF